MTRIDAHQHFWKFNPIKDAWINEDMKILKRDFMPQELQSILEKNGVQACIAVQADQSLEETHFLLKLASEFHFIKGVVGWVDLQSENLEEHLDVFAEEKRLKGFRHIVQAEQDPEFLKRPAFLAGIQKLRDRRYTYDLLIVANQLPQALDFAKNTPDDLPIIIDHLAKPNLIENEFEQWAEGMKSLAAHENFYCKLSGLVTEAHWSKWQITDFEPYINHVLNCFGPARIIFGSDWPVCTVAAEYNEMITIVEHYVHQLSQNEQEMIWHKNAETFYNL